jgi:transposase
MRTDYILGLDVAKSKVRFELADADGQALSCGSASTDAAGLRQLLETLRPHTAPSCLLVVMESTGLLHLGWAEALTRAGAAVVVLNPLVSKRLSALANAIRDHKTYAVDAHGLAEIGRLHGARLERFRYHRDAARFGLQRLHTIRAQLRHSLTNLKKSYASLLDSVFPELGRLVSIHNRAVRKLLAEAPTPHALQRQCVARLRRAFGAKTDAVLTAARCTLANPELAQACVPALQAALQSMEQLSEQLQRMDAQLTALLPTVVSPAQLALARTVPGIGEKTAVTVLGHLPADWVNWGGRKKTSAKLEALMGNDPRLRQSGQWEGCPRMSKRGIEPLRTCLFQAAFCAMIHDAVLRAYYDRKRAQGKPHKVALSHLMRILTRRLVAVLMTGKPYEAIYASTPKST